MIDVDQPLNYDEGFPKVHNALYRLYPLLDDFTLETTALYGYLKSWENNDKDHPMYGKMWLSLANMEALTGMSYFRLRKNIDILVKYGLVSAEKSEVVRNKWVYQTLEPLTEAEFRAHFPEAINRLRERLAEVEEQLAEDRERRKKSRAEKCYKQQ